MTQKKDFSSMNINPVYSSIAEATAEQKEPVTDPNGTQTDNEPQKAHRKPQKPRKTYTEEEAADYLETMQTAGRKGVALPRINLAFTPSNYEYIKIMAQVTGQTLTEFVNMVLEESRKAKADTYQQAIAFRNSFKHDS